MQIILIVSTTGGGSAHGFLASYIVDLQAKQYGAQLVSQGPNYAIMNIQTEKQYAAIERRVEENVSWSDSAVTLMKLSGTVTHRHYFEQARGDGAVAGQAGHAAPAPEDDDDDVVFLREEPPAAATTKRARP